MRRRSYVLVNLDQNLLWQRIAEGQRDRSRFRAERLGGTDVAAFAERTGGFRDGVDAGACDAVSAGELSVREAQLFGVGMASAASVSIAGASMPRSSHTFLASAACSVTW
jgi:hypothetical protein